MQDQGKNSTLIHPNFVSSKILCNVAVAVGLYTIESTRKMMGSDTKSNNISYFCAVLHVPKKECATSAKQLCMCKKSGTDTRIYD